MSGYFTGQEYVRRLEQIEESLLEAHQEIKQRRFTVTGDIDSYSFPGYKMAEIEKLFGDVLTLKRAIREAVG